MLALLGAPSVMMMTWSASLKQLVKAIVDTNSVVGARSGSVMWRKVRQPVAPSMEAASSTSALMLCRPERKNTIKYPASRHTYITAMAGSTVSLLDSTLSGPTPIAIMIWSNRPLRAM